MHLKLIADWQGMINVRNYGAVGGSVSADTAAFQAAYAAIADNGAPILVPPAPNGGRYQVNANFFASAPARRSAQMLLDGVIETTTPLNIPREHQITGMARGVLPTDGLGIQYSGSCIVAGAGFSGSYIVRLGDLTGYSHGVRISNLRIGGGSQNLVGIVAPTIQELSGIEDVLITDVESGIDITADGTFPAYNWFIKNVEIYPRSGSTGFGINVVSGGASQVIDKATVIPLGGPTGSFIAYRLVGPGIKGRALHSENCATGLRLGATSPGVRTTNVHIDGLIGWDAAGAMTKLLHVPSAGYTDNYRVDDLQFGAGVGWSTQLTVDDALNNVAMLAAEFPNVGFYGVSEQPGSANQMVHTSAYMNQCNLTLASGTIEQWNVKGAMTARVTADAGGSTVNSIAGFTNGRHLRLWKQGGGTLTFAHDAGAGPGKIYCKGGSDITLAADELLEMQYNLGPYQYWYAWKP